MFQGTTYCILAGAMTHSRCLKNSHLMSQKESHTWKGRTAAEGKKARLLSPKA